MSKETKEYKSTYSLPIRILAIVMSVLVAGGVAAYLLTLLGHLFF